MGNQQPSPYEEDLFLLAKNAKFGDGYYWRHPECKNSKVIYNSINKELLELKLSLADIAFKSGVREKKRASNHFANAKPIYEIATTSFPMFTKYHKVPKHIMFKYLTLKDFALWYLDDGGFVMRKETVKGRQYQYPRYYLCIGDCCSTKLKTYLFTKTLIRLFGDKWGSIRKNNSKATKDNKTWYIPKPVAEMIIAEAKKFDVMHHKFPEL